MVETQFQKNKKNNNRLLAKERGFFQSTQKRSYKPKKVVEVNKEQRTLL